MIDIEFSTIAFTIINLIVLFLLLKKFLIGPINDVIKKREDMIAGNISDANNQKAEAMKLKAQYEDTLAGDRKSTRLNSSHDRQSRMPSSA